MNQDRFKNYDPEVRELVLSFEKQTEGNTAYFDVDQLEVIADFYLEVYDTQGLEAAVALGEQLFPTSCEIRLRRAHLLNIQGRYPEALTILHELESAEPDNTDVSYALGALYSQIGQTQKSIDHYLKAATDGYQIDVIYCNIADEYYKLGQYDQAIEYYIKSIDQNPDEGQALYNLACIWDSQGNNEKSQQFFSQLVADHPYSKNGWYCLGGIYGSMSLFEKAVDAYEYAIAIDKAFVQAYHGLSDCYRQMGDTARAVQALHDCLDYTQDRPYVYYCMGSAFMESHNYHTASAYLHDAVKEDPSYALAWNNLGFCCEQLGLHEEADGHYRRAINLEPDVDENWLSLADLYIKNNQYEGACITLENARHDAAVRFAFNTRLIYCYFKLGRRNKLFEIMIEDGKQYGYLYPTLLQVYPELSQDIEIVDFINSFNTNE